MPIIEITTLDHPGCELFGTLTEAQLRREYEPGKGLFIAESPKVINVALNSGNAPLALMCEQRHITGDAADIIARCGDIPVFTADEELLCGLTGYHLTRGVLCAMRRPQLPSPRELLQNVNRVAILENVMNPTNVGAIFRSAAALGMDAVLLTPGCSNPLYRRSARVSMGTVFQIPWGYIGEDTADWPGKGMELLKELGFKTAALALTDDSVSIDDPALLAEEKLAVILGSEGDGLTDHTIASSDYTVKIPMYHGVDSLNVAAASAVAFWELRKR